MPDVSPFAVRRASLEPGRGGGVGWSELAPRALGAGSRRPVGESPCPGGVGPAVHERGGSDRLAGTGAAAIAGEEGARDGGGGVLGPRDLEILRSLSEGASIGATGRRLGVSERTVRRRVAVICTRLGARNVPEAVAVAFRRGFLS